MTTFLTKELPDLSAATTLNNTDLLMIHDGSGLKKETAANVASEIARINCGGTSPEIIAEHNSHVRGKVLTDIYTIAQIETMIANRNYEDIYVGDIIKVTISAITESNFSGGVTPFEVAEIEGCKYYGDSITMDKGHLVMIPRDTLGSAHMNESNVTTGGYYGSYMHTTVIPVINTALKSAFGSDHILTTREIMSTAVNTSATSAGYGTENSGATSSCGWYDCCSRLMTEAEVYGFKNWSSSGHDTSLNH